MKSPILLICLMLGIAGSASAETRVITLGTGTPILDANRAGAGIAVVYNGRAYLFDVGGGVVRRAIEANQRLGVSALNPTNIDRVFLTHLHSDHMLDFVELVSTYWWRRNTQIRVWGPEGVDAMANGMVAMMAADTRVRTSGNQPVTNPEFHKAIPTEIKPGFVFEENGIRIEAFEVEHGDIRPAFGYKITTPDKTIVISGDTRYSAKLVEMARGADILFHEVIGEEGLKGLDAFWQKYHSSSHTTSTELARVANAARPGLLVLYHVAVYSAPPDSALKEVQAVYKGRVVMANDLDAF
jgi:ribonuclease BN (tRNA processing enzyme)